MAFHLSVSYPRLAFKTVGINTDVAVETGVVGAAVNRPDCEIPGTVKGMSDKQFRRLLRCSRNDEVRVVGWATAFGCEAAYAS